MLHRLIFSLALAACYIPTAQAAPADQTCFPATNRCISERFGAFWQANGALPVFGVPLSDRRSERSPEGAFATQWFERERFEAHPQNTAPYDVLLGRLGDELLKQQGRDWQTFPTGQPQNGCQFFKETQHTLCEPFLSYWRSHGLEFDGVHGFSPSESLALFGLPLSEIANETNSSGDTVVTQWFERARFEFHPQNPDPYKVLLGRLGAEAYEPNSGNGPIQYVQVQRARWPHALEVPKGFSIDEVASGLKGPRFMARDPLDGSIVYGSQATSEVIRLRDSDGDGRYETQQVIAGGLPYVHSVAFATVNGTAVLYAAAEDRVISLGTFDLNGLAQRITTIATLPSGAKDLYGHRTRTIAQGPDGKLYVSVGSSCDVCLEDTPQRAAILRMNSDGSNLEVYAAGLRNTVGFAWRPFTQELWGVDMGRNNIGLDNPPDELNRIEQNKQYGWPYCYGANLPNPEFNDAGRCQTTVKPTLELPAHYAPLGFAFYDALSFPGRYRSGALIAFHGTAKDQVGDRLGGYSVAFLPFSDNQPTKLEDLVRGWNASGDVWGRPAGLLLLPDGSVLISDDFGGRVFRLHVVGR